MAWKGEFFRLLMKEEYRLNTSFTSRGYFMSFPAVIAFFSFLGGAAAPAILRDSTAGEILLYSGLSALLYGIAVGSIAFLGREMVERRFGQVGFLLTLPAYHPIPYRTALLLFFIKDVLFYLAFTLSPVAAGLFLSLPVSGLPAGRVALFMLAVTLAFLEGVSFSYAASVLYLHRPWALALLAAAVAGAVVAIRFASDLPLESLLLPALSVFRGPAGAGAAVAAALPVLLVAGSTLAIGDRFEWSERGGGTAGASKAGPLPVWPLSRPYGYLMPKEFRELGRSGTVPKLFFSFVVPLVIISFTIYLVKKGTGLPVAFNLLFYGSMIGFSSVMLYSWLTMSDTTEYYRTLPVGVPVVVKAKLLLYYLLALPLGSIFLVGMAVIAGETARLPVGFAVMASTAAYTGSSTAYLTGLRTNTYLFNSSVLFKFAVLSLFPMVGVTVVSMGMQAPGLLPTAIILGICGLMVLATLNMLRWIDRKWAGEEF